MTLTEIILSKAANKNKVYPDDFVEIPIDQILIHELLGGSVYSKFEKLNKPVWNPKKIALFADHSFPPTSARYAGLLNQTYEFARKHGITNFYPGQGVCHQLLPEKGHVLPGKIIVGADSHTTTHGAFGAFATGIGSTEMAWVLAEGRLWFKVPKTIRCNLSGTLKAGVMAKDVSLNILKMITTAGANYACMEFGGPFIEQLGIDERMVLTNMALEMGAKNAIIAPDHTTLDYLKRRGIELSEFPRCSVEPDYWQILDIDIGQIPPLTACPHSPDNVRPISELGDIAVNRVFIGSCTGGRINDLRISAEILKDKEVAPGVILLIIPASREIYMHALREGLIEIFLKAGAILSNPGCGPCGGTSIGVLSKDDVCVSTSSRNFPGRMGSGQAEIYLASPATAAATALVGNICDPGLYIKRNAK